MPAVRRYHSLDALRAAMMLLGVVLHAMASYTTFPLNDAWPFRDAHTSPHFNLPLFVIHVFRMPAFFALAGFFAAMLDERGGLRTLVVNRIRRVLLPLVVFWFALAPLVGAGFVFAIHMSTQTSVVDIVTANISSGAANTMHLWFLHYLVIFYCVASVSVWLSRGAALPQRLCAMLTTSWWTPLFWSVVTAASLSQLPYPVLEASTRLLPPFWSLAGYGLFFLFGWLLFCGRERLQVLARRAWMSSALAVAMIGMFIALEVAPPSADARTMHVLRSMVSALCTWAAVVGGVGLCLRYVTRERATVTYLSRAAYWVYLVHLPIVITAAGALAPLPLHAFVKFSIVFGVATAVSLVSYHYWVRDTVVGVLLNGRRVSSPTGSVVAVS